MSKEIKSLLNNFFQQNNSWQIHLISNWKSIVGKLKDHATLEKIEDNTLIISVSNSSWLQELYILSNMLITKINNQLSYPYVKKLKFRLREKKSFKLRKKADNNIKIKTNIKLTRREELALKNISDVDLSKELKKFLIKCKEIKK